MSAYRSSDTGLYVVSAANITFAPPPDIQDGDILVAVIFGSANGQVPAISGFTSIHSTNSSNFAGHREVLWKRASGESGSYTTTGLSSGTNWGVIFCIRGAVESGSPSGAISGTDKTNSGTALTCAAITPSADGCTVMEVAASTTGTLVASAWTDTGALLTWHQEFQVNQASDMLAASAAVQATAASVQPSATASVSNFAHMIALAVLPALNPPPTPPVGEPALLAVVERRLGG